MNTSGIVSVVAVLLATVASATDFASPAERDTWVAHPIYGEASFDSFTHSTGNPIVRGKAPLDWPVNIFFFEDPASGNWYAYVGHYGRNYTAEVPMRCTVSRSSDRGASWEDLGPIFPDTPHIFDGEQSPEGHAPDVSVVYHDGRYHMVYDWMTENSNWGDIFNPVATQNSGVGYAWSDKPEGPFHRSPKPVATTRDQTALLGKYRRQYASTIIRRAEDWLVLTLTDSGPNFGWAYVGRTAKQPEGPWSEATMLLHPEGDTYHPPLLEFHPSFAQDGYVYAPATSVAMNRNVQALFRAPMESAMDPAAWELYQLGSVWHAEAVENEYDGIWGQAFSGFVGSDGHFNVLFPSRDPGGFGTINRASRPWKQPYADQGFVVSAHRGPSLALLKRAGVPKRIKAALVLQGKVEIVWGASMPLGPDAPRSDASLHPLMKTRHASLELCDGHWRLLNADDVGGKIVIAEGDYATGEQVVVDLAWQENDTAMLRINEKEAWSGAVSPAFGAFGMLLQARSHARVSTFVVEGDLAPAARRYLWTEGVLCAAQQMKDWTVMNDNGQFTYSEGAVSTGGAISAKWNVEGSQVVLYAPKGPDFGRAKVYVDGTDSGEIDYHATEAGKSNPVFEKRDLTEGRHTVRLESVEGRIPLDILEVIGG